MPVLNNPSLTPTLTVYYHDNGVDKIAYIVLFNYANNPSSRTAHIHINWDTVKAGFSATDSFPVTNIQRISFSGFTSHYNLPVSYAVKPAGRWLYSYYQFSRDWNKCKVKSESCCCTPAQLWDLYQL